MARFEGRVGFVSGGGTGIGKACARAIVEGGGLVMLAGRRKEVPRKAAAELGSRAAWIECDVTRDVSVEEAVETTVARLGPLRLAVNAAGMGSGGTVLNCLPAEFAQVIDTNLTGVFRCLRAEARAMKSTGGGSIVNIGSIAGALTHRWMTAYCASKAGVNMLTRCAADDLGEFGIRVNAVMPGLVETELAAPLLGHEPSRSEYLRRMPLSRIGQPDDVAASVAFLLSDESSWVTGQCIGVDGGHTLRQGPELIDFFSQFLPPER